LLGVYIHNIKDQNGKTDVEGLNPFEYVGVYIDEKGKAIYCERNEWQDFISLELILKDRTIHYDRNGNKWIKLDDFPNCSLPFPKEYWTNKIYPFSYIFKVYDWVLDNGYYNLGKWIEEVARQMGK